MDAQKIPDIKNIHSICKKVLKITDEELADADKIAAEQWNYTHPLKMGKASRLQAAGSHNQRVLAALRNLRDTIKLEA